MSSKRKDPFEAFRYAVEIEQLIVGGFSEVSGIGFESEVETFREGGFNGNLRQLPGAVAVTRRLVLHRGVGDAEALWAWFRAVAGGRLKRRDLSVLLIAADRSELRRWKFIRACPVKWSGPELRAKASEYAVESLEFVHEGLAP
jgi:phage tail-like protein